MKILTYGSRFFGGQVDRIDEGFLQLGHELVKSYRDADLIYTNDGGFYKQLVIDKLHGRISGKIIMNVLDIPEHLFPNVDLKDMKNMLLQADAVCSISEFVKWQLEHYLELKSSVIYQPIKPISYKPELRHSNDTHFASVGRRSDPNKRFNLGLGALQYLGMNYGQLALVGNEYARWGTYLGVLKDDQLNEVYNNTDFVLATGKVEGLNLPVLEAMAAGCIPIVCNDMTTRKEILPPDLFPEFDAVNPEIRDVMKFIASFMQDNDARQKMKERLHGHFLTNWKDKTSPIGVANSIVKVYESIK